MPLKLKNYYCGAFILFFISCNQSVNTSVVSTASIANDNITVVNEKYYKGALTNGMKRDSIFFTVSADNKTLSDLTFKGYWRCAGKLERSFSGPEGSFKIKDGKVNDHISEPPDGGSTAWRFDLDAEIKNDKASGTFRMNIANLDCNTGKLNFTAVKYKK